MASEAVIDEIVPPCELRDELAARFAFYEDVEKDRCRTRNTARCCSRTTKWAVQIPLSRPYPHLPMCSVHVDPRSRATV